MSTPRRQADKPVNAQGVVDRTFERLLGPAAATGKAQP